MSSKTSYFIAVKCFLLKTYAFFGFLAIIKLYTFIVNYAYFFESVKINNKKCQKTQKLKP